MPLSSTTGRALRKILVVQHVPHEPLGTLDALLRRHKIRIKFVNFARQPDALPDLAGYDALIVLGGPMNVDEAQRHPHLLTEMRLIEAALRADLPILGICLGAQLLAHVLGAHVGRNGKQELGWHEVRLTLDGACDPALQHLAGGRQVFHWHGDTFAVPQSAVLLAESDLCAHQAFRYGRSAYGLQFHLEADEPVIDRWLRVYQAELNAVAGLDAARQIQLQTRRHLPGMRQLGDAVFIEMLRIFGWHERGATLQLGHRMTVPVPKLD
jgi:GMP synthase (glutamine-hydrolysing)